MNKEIQKEADRLFKIYFDLIPAFSGHDQHRWQCIQCAIKCVEEIDEAIDFDWMEVQNLDRVHAYWSAVKKNLEDRL